MHHTPHIPVRPESESRSVKPIMTVLNLQMVREREQKGVRYREFGREIKCVKLEDKVWPSFRQDHASRRGYDSLPGLAMLHTDQNLRTQITCSCSYRISSVGRAVALHAKALLRDFHLDGVETARMNGYVDCASSFLIGDLK